MEYELSAEDLLFHASFTDKNISLVCLFCGMIAPLDGGYFSAVRIYPNEPTHLFFVCSAECGLAVTSKSNRAAVNRVLNRQVELTRKFDHYNKTKRHG